VCPDFPANGQCDGKVAEWCDSSSDGMAPNTLDCSTLTASCGSDPSFGAWCSVPAGKPCTVQGQSRAGYFYCGDSGPQAGLACDLDKGCVSSGTTCTPGATVPYCDLDTLVVDCTPWGQAVQRQCKALGAVGCAAGACVGVPMGGMCGPNLTCVDGLTCDATTHTCGFQAAAHSALPQVQNLGGTVLHTPKVMPISWMLDPQEPVLDRMVQELTGTSYWGITTSEYGVGALTGLAPVHMPDPIPATYTDDQVTALISANTTGASPAWGAPSSSTVYMIAIPKGVPFTDGQGSKCCQDYDGYHTETRVGGTIVPYAVVCTCPGFDGPSESDDQQLTAVISHELVEASTDPFPSSRPAYAQTDDAHAVWTIVTQGELADMCELNADANVVPTDGTYMVQRTWSNKAAAAGKNPCVPAPDLYAGTEPSMPAMGNVQYGGPWMTEVVKIPLGQTGSVDLPLYTNGVMGAWTVKAWDYNAEYYGGTQLLDLKLDRQMGNNGDVLHLTITPQGFDSMLKAAIFVIESDFGNGNQSLAMGVVVPQ
jgi:hypothetical protein